MTTFAQFRVKMARFFFFYVWLHFIDICCVFPSTETMQGFDLICTGYRLCLTVILLLNCNIRGRY